MKNITSKIIFVMLILLVSRVDAQINISISTDQEFNDNPFRYPDAQSSIVSSYQLGLEKPIGNFNLGYYGNYSSFNKFTDRDYYWHQFGGWLQEENFTAGIYAEQRLNKSDYEYFDYTNTVAYLRFNFSVEDFNITVNPSVTYTSFQWLEQLNNFSPALSLRINKSPWEGTTFIGGFAYTYKNYGSYKISYSTTDSTTTVTHGGRGYGNGYSGNTTYSESIVTYTQELPSISHISSYFRIAQSLFETTGLAVQFTNGTILSNKTKSYLDIEMTYGDESDIFDDPIRFEGNSIGAELTQILPLDIMMKLGYYHNVKKYPMDGIFTDAENYDDLIERNDTQNSFFIFAKKSIPLNEDEDISLDISLQYLMLQNKSNSYWYNFNQNSFSINANFHF